MREFMTSGGIYLSGLATAALVARVITVWLALRGSTPGERAPILERLPEVLKSLGPHVRLLPPKHRLRPARTNLRPTASSRRTRDPGNDARRGDESRPEGAP